MSITDVVIKNAKFIGKPFKFYDSGGLYILINKSGKYFRMDYRYFGKRKTYAIGVYPKVSLKQARIERDKAKELLDEGIDPSRHKQETKQVQQRASQNTFEVVAREWFERKKGSWSEGHARTVIQRLERNIFPYVGNHPILDITPQKLLAVLRLIESREAFDTARRMRGICSQIFRYAISTGTAERDPAADLKGALTEAPVKHMATITDPKQIGELLKAIDGYSGSIITKCALKLAPLVFVRPGELRHAEWPEIDFDDSLWRIPPEKMKMRGAHLVPLSTQAIEVLREIELHTGHLPGKGYIFPSERSYQRCMSENTINAALRRLGYSTEEMTGHGFRSMASTNLHEQGWKSEIIERQLAHVEKNTVKAAYNHVEYLDERRKMMQAWGDYLDQLKAGRAEKVVPIRRARG